MAIEFSSDFETGNGELVNITGDEVVFRAESKRGALVLWWHFELRDVAARQLTVVLENAADVMGGLESLERVMPVVNFLGKDWHRLPPGEVDRDADAWRFRLTVPREAPVVSLAFCYPYGYSRALDVAHGWAKSGAELATLCQSPGGRDVPVLLFGDAEAAGREMIVATARHHAGETPGSFVLEGFIETFLAAGACGRWLRERGLLVVLPVMDVDGVAEGSFGKGQSPVDLNRDWAGASRWPQVAEARKLLADLADRHNYRLFLDFHAPCANQPNFICLVPEEALPESLYHQQQRFCHLLEEHQSHWFDFCCEDSYVCVGEQEQPGVSTLAQAREHGCPGVTLETTYNFTRAGREGSPLRYRQHGLAIADAAVAFVQSSQ
ncbi:MAG: hypothetical protein J7M26_08550 [Armatimonadetes bacterium]|nr:hypothetical protein [Armatimonadota bacterium]